MMFTRKFIITVLLISLTISFAMLSGCSAVSRTTGPGVDYGYDEQVLTPPEYTQAATEAANGYEADKGGIAQSGETVAGDAVSDSNSVIAGNIEIVSPGRIDVNTILMQRKIIRNANLSIEVEDFDVAYGKIKTIIAPYGFVQETNIKKEKYYVESQENLITRGVITVRVDRAHFDEILSGLRDLGLVYDEMISSNDVTDQYFDIESHLRLLKYEQERLEAYLLKATDPDVIFRTESRLTDIRHEIESLTGNLNKLDDLVDLSTITLNLNEKIPGIENVPTTTPYLEKLWNGFMQSLKSVTGFFGDILILVVAALPVLVVLALIVLVLFLIVRAMSRKMRRNNGAGLRNPNGPNNPSNPSNPSNPGNPGSSDDISG